jgi:hypothetical protein
MSKLWLVAAIDLDDRELEIYSVWSTEAEADVEAKRIRDACKEQTKKFWEWRDKQPNTGPYVLAPDHLVEGNYSEQADVFEVEDRTSK